jgi:hypothetical protein
MTVVMYDSVNPAAIPSNAQLVAAYVDGYGGYSAAVARFGASKVVSISVGNNDADVADVETGAMTPADLPGWLTRQRARGIARPGVYCNQSTWPAVKVAVAGTAVAYWIADPAGPALIAGADAAQNTWTGTWDSSVCQPSWPWYNGQPTPTPPKPPPTPPPPKPPVVTSGTQVGWSWCVKCGVLFWPESVENVCAAGAKHDGHGSFDYTLTWKS